jgi:hypothetical protein
MHGMHPIVERIVCFERQSNMTRVAGAPIGNAMQYAIKSRCALMTVLAIACHWIKCSWRRSSDLQRRSSGAIQGFASKNPAGLDGGHVGPR